MKRILELEGITEGQVKRELESLFPELKSSFKQRKQFDEYYYTETEITLTLDKLELLTNNLGFCTEIYCETIILR